MQEKVQFVASLGQRASAVMMSGDGSRCIVTLEAYQMQAAAALAVLQYSGTEFLVTVQPIPKSWTKLDDETKTGTKEKAIRVGRRRITDG